MAPQIHTYHCLCTSLVLASTHSLSSLPRRGAPALDNAVILPLPAIPNTSELSELGSTVLLDMQKDGKAAIVRREDGFEKRHPWRCGRCNLMIGYELDEEHFEDAEGGEKGKGKVAGRTRVLYVLPGGVMDTETMASGKKIDEAHVGLGGSGVPPAAFETGII